MNAITRPLRVVLVGPIQQENLALQYLASSARRAGGGARPGRVGRGAGVVRAEAAPAVAADEAHAEPLAESKPA